MKCKICRRKPAAVKVIEAWHNDKASCRKEYEACHDCMTNKARQIAAAHGCMKVYTEFSVQLLPMQAAH